MTCALSAWAGPGESKIGARRGVANLILKTETCGKAEQNRRAMVELLNHLPSPHLAPTQVFTAASVGIVGSR